MRTAKALVLLSVLFLGSFGCRKSEETATPSQSSRDRAQLAASNADAKVLSSEELAQAVAQARAKAFDRADPKKDSRKFVAEFEAALSPQIGQRTGKYFSLLPMDLGKSADPLYSNYAALIALRDDTSNYRGDPVRGAQRREAVYLPGSECTAVLIARNAIVTANHCVNSKNLLFGPTAAGGTPFELDPKKLGPLKTSDGKVLDMVVRLLKKPFKDIPETDFPVFASQKMIDEAKELILVGYGGAAANSSAIGIKRLGTVPTWSTDCRDADLVSKLECHPGFEIVAGSRPTAERVSCPLSNAPNPIQGACRGDSGAPVYVEGADKKLYLAGIARKIFEQDCGCATATNVYVRLDKQLSAIKSIPGIDIPATAFSQVGTP
jgi:hypothetical protein